MLDYDPNHHLMLKGDIWYFVVRRSGVLRRRSLGTRDVQKARRERDKLLRAVDRPRPTPVPAVVVTEKTWDDAAEAFIAEVLVGSRRYAASSITRYEVSIRQLTPVLTGYALSDITTATVLDYIAARKAENEDISSSTLKNDLTTWSMVTSHAVVKRWTTENPAKTFDRRYLAADVDPLSPPTDAQLLPVIGAVEGWQPQMALLLRWLRETGMRLQEALLLRRAHIHPDGVQATLRDGVKRNRAQGLKTRTIHLGRAADLLPALGKDRLFDAPHIDPVVVSTRYGQWWRQQKAREAKAAEYPSSIPLLHRFRLHDLRHAYAMASIVDHPNRLGELMLHLGHAHPSTTVGYTRWLNGEGSMWRYERDPALFGSLPVA